MSRFLWRPKLRDPSDEMVLEAAINGSADALVTFNRRDFGDTPRRIRHRRLNSPRSNQEAFGMKRPVSTYPLRLPTSLKAAVARISKEDGDKYQPVS